MKRLVLSSAAAVALSSMGICSPAGAASGVSASTTLQNGYATNETFCNSHGIVDYRVTKKAVAITLGLHSLTPKKQYSLAWQNNNVRGYTIGVFGTTSTGSVTPGTLRLFRDAETRGIGVVVYYLSGVDPKAIIHFKPCEAFLPNSPRPRGGHRSPRIFSVLDQWSPRTVTYHGTARLHRVPSN